MADTDDHLLELAERMANRESIDWRESLQATASGEEADLVAALRVISEISDVHSELATETSELPEGQRWGPLAISAKLGEGSFAEVYRARDVNLDRVVALKLLRPMRQGIDNASGLRTDGPSNEGAVLLEGRLLARIKHPHVATIYGAAILQGRVGLWMELIEGQTLKEIVEGNGSLGCREATLVALDLARALGAVHHLGILHRDIKAQNVMREAGGRVVLMDFGIGHDLKEAHREEVISGTPLYLAPELLDGEPASKRSDIYSLGVLLFFLVSGLFPTRAGSLNNLREAHHKDQHTSLRELRPGLPEPFLRLVERCLARKPRRRFASMAELESNLVALLAIDESTGEIPVVQRRKRGWVRWASAGLIAITAALLFWHLASRRGNKNQIAAINLAVALQESPCLAEIFWDSVVSDRIEFETQGGPAAAETCLGVQPGRWKLRVFISEKTAELNVWGHGPDDVRVDTRDVPIGGGPAQLSAAAAELALKLRFTEFKESSLPERAPFLQHASTNHPEALKLFHRAKGLEYEEEIRALHQAVRLDPRFGLAWAELSQVLAGQGRYQEAYDAAKVAHDLAEESSHLSSDERCMILGTYHSARFDYRAALDGYGECISKGTKNPNLYRQTSLALERQDELQRAIGKIEQAIERDPSTHNYVQLAILYAKQGEPREALVAIEAGRDGSEDPYLLWGEGFAYLVGDDLDAAESRFRRMVATDGTYESNAAFFLAQAALMRGNLPGALAAIRAGGRANELGHFEARDADAIDLTARILLLLAETDPTRAQDSRSEVLRLARQLAKAPDLPLMLKWLRSAALLFARAGDVDSFKEISQRIATLCREERLDHDLAVAIQGQLQIERAILRQQALPDLTLLETTLRKSRDPLTLDTVARYWLAQDNCAQASAYLEELEGKAGTILHDHPATLLIEAENNLRRCREMK